MAQGSYRVWPADRDGEPIGFKTGQPNQLPDPTDENAVLIYFGIPANVPQPPPKDQIDLQEEISKVLRTLQLIYHQSSGTIDGRRKAQFRTYYVRLFRLAQLGLEGPDVFPEIAKSALSKVTTDLIDDEASRVKNGHLMKLGWTAISLGIPFTLVYVFMQLVPKNSKVVVFLQSLGIDQYLFANFMLLWIGCFLGVWLSYGIRTSVFTLQDLTVTDSDRLRPGIRLLFAGCLTMILGIMFMLGVVQLSIGNYSLTDFSSKPMLAFLVGTFCGISELMLPTAVGKRASDFIGKSSK